MCKEQISLKVTLIHVHIYMYMYICMSCTVHNINYVHVYWCAYYKSVFDIYCTVLQLATLQQSGADKKSKPFCDLIAFLWPQQREMALHRVVLHLSSTLYLQPCYTYVHHGQLDIDMYIAASICVLYIIHTYMDYDFSFHNYTL